MPDDSGTSNDRNNSNNLSNGSDEDSNNRRRNEDNQHSHSNRNDRTSASQNSSSNRSNSNRSHRLDFGIFDRFMDTFLRGSRGRNHNVRGPSPVRNDISEQLTNENNARDQQGQSEQSSQRLSSEPPSSTSSASNRDEESDRAIIITVNYVFSDENRPAVPNRSGSLIMSLPNNASNREPSVIQEFIRLATQMAYSSIVTGLNRERGTTIEKFKSFDNVKLHDLGENQICSICYEKFEAEEEDETVSHKKRRLVDETSQTTSSSSNARNTREGESEEEQPSPSNPSQPVYLSEYVGEFNHSAVKMPCSHIFGKGCLCEWLKLHTTCPLCRFSVSEETTPETDTNDRTNNVSFFTIPADGNTNPLGNVTVQNNFSNAPSNDQPPPRVHYFGFSPIPSPGSTTPSSNSRSNPIETPLRRIFRSTRARREREARQNQESNDFPHIDPFAFDYLRNRLATSDRQPEPLFPFGMSSRRTANGVETTSTDQVGSESEDNLNMRSLFDASPMPEARRNEDDTRVGNGRSSNETTSNNESSTNISHGDGDDVDNL
ncbi:ubiquitin-protein ligase, putative [Candida dubliniensis CD36]|uniref:Ubiquitin-protein ligase, putative n=1 Tax=Candida dubliniensis (strain CD36 / ATCC MYA-646 / CBS 7987 / NCPF 3949 / NRRL Y-17841) TaxID=573826 RepID=B9WD67_CANDC|nr:ubiquitin-protein ligase, putative [Candida dubliniensis CD36]CAX42616.1 ubiquitin-protein ligase, putative [Candida dubliniensis CD36]